MTRVPVSTLMKCGCVSKHWYKSILHNPHFPIAYLAKQPKKRDLPFVFYILNVLEDDDSSSKFRNRNYIFRLEEYDDDDNKDDDYGVDSLMFDAKMVIESGDENCRIELVGNCNGLVCLSRSRNCLDDGVITIVNPSTDEILNIFSPPIIKDSGWFVCCYGFGFDPFTHEYKVVLIVSTTATAFKNSEFKCLVFTLGTNSWRETSTTIPLPVTTTSSFYKSAIFCGGALFWRTKSSSLSDNNNNMLLLSFDLQDDEFQVIRPPAECTSSSLLEQEHQIIDPLLEFKGSPCVARLEKTILGGRGWSYDGQNTSYCYRVHLYILKEYNKVDRLNEQVWSKETIDVAPLTFTTDLSSSVPCFMSNDTTISNVPPNRMMISSDGRVFLYCFIAGQCIQAYDLQTKRLIVSNCGKYLGKFYKKIYSEVYDQIDYHLSGGHIENFMSMLAFIPKGGGGGAPPRLDNDELISILDDKQKTLPVVGYLRVGHQKSADTYFL